MGAINLTSPSQVKLWCIENGFHPNKVMGQNFLIDRNALLAIVDSGLRAKPENVLEIGPGLGVLTEEMLSRGVKVLAIEKDPVLADRLADALGGHEGLAVVKGDALDFIAALEDREGGGFQSPFPSALVSNLPYQAGTRILLSLAMTRRMETMTVLVQTEVAERLAAKEGGKTRSLAGVWVQLDYDVKIVRKVAASCFWPRPEVGSSVVELTRHERNAGLSGEVRAMFRRIVKQAFEHRRKQLGSIFKGIIDSTLRAEQLTNEEWVELAKGLCGQ